MNVSFRRLRAFILIAETSSFTRTAEQLHLSQPALSYSIRKLEESMGLQLLARNTRSVELTPAGEHFLPQARRMLRDMNDAVRDARHPEPEPWHAPAGGLAHRCGVIPADRHCFFPA